MEKGQSRKASCDLAKEDVLLHCGEPVSERKEFLQIMVYENESSDLPFCEYDL
jgi:hypothetical protein